MGLQYKSGFCKKCDANRKVERPAINHILHLILSVLTAGLWIIIWVGSAIRIGGWRCSTCGSTKVSKIS